MKILKRFIFLAALISLLQIVILPNYLRKIFFTSNLENVNKIRIKAKEICNKNILWGEPVEKDSILSLICELDDTNL